MPVDIARTPEWAAASFDAFPAQNQTERFFQWVQASATLAGLIGLGGAEFRLPFLISLFPVSVRWEARHSSTRP